MIILKQFNRYIQVCLDRSVRKNEWKENESTWRKQRWISKN